MVEMADILNQYTQKVLLFWMKLAERGISTYGGIFIAEAIIDFCRC
jgi:DNA mismatch repair ATPase MutS